ncbi:hypothetical protein NF867_17535 [Solitalea sp. MAHUQ-68]|uniref:Uncharacterized protein n=1 Tax=Solitalea agri TaxID=2953739 RepID=A0A9X2JE01_9SPHI|nr:hypothetical protein [Solitalea agri]MCO4294668.1 hypothetical protein [Solitalea agri]
MDNSNGNELTMKIPSGNYKKGRDNSNSFNSLLGVPKATIFNEMLKKSLVIKKLLLKLKQNLA